MKQYLVIGASSGIGKSLAKLLQTQGHQVIGTYHRHAMASDAGINYYPLDVTETTLDMDFLTDPLDGLVYCPGSINLKPFTRVKPQDFLDDYHLQLVGAVKVIQAALPCLKKSDSASIVLYSTVAVHAGYNFHTQVAASKGAVEGFTRALAAEMAPAIRVNGIAPSITDTPLASILLNSDEKKQANASRHPLKRIGSPEDIAEMTAFLLSDKAGWITGQVLHVDGGLSRLRV